jgi:cyclopropane-fatty-acyl-phospholipid synthase
MNATVSTTRRFLDRLFAEAPLERVALRLWDGSRWPDDRPRPATVVLKHPGAVRSMLASRNAKGLGEAYLRDDFDVEGDIEESLELAVALENKRSGWVESVANYCRLLRLPSGKSLNRDLGPNSVALTGEQHSLRRDRKAVSFHYDVSNDFYALWLDRRLVYSCGYFESPEDDLDTAQANKLRHLCRKLRLQPGQRLLDIGCGWGGLAIYAARNFGVHVVGVTLSEQQARLATERVREAGLAGRVQIELRDYREVRPPVPFDAIVSVGMSEHVGRDHLPGYFQTAWNLLRSGGVFLNHAIGEGRRADRFHGPSFVNEHVFPDADIPPIPVVLSAASSPGFDVRDVENLREHYTLTLRHWVRRLEASREKALNYVDETTYRVWRLYMAASAHGFHHGDLGLYQVLLSKPLPDGSAQLPLTRRDWYA